MIFHECGLKGLYTISLSPIGDQRGFFVRSFCAREFSAIGDTINIVQVNHSLTREKGAIRGMHFQLPPFCEKKIIRCIKGTVFDVAVDLRAGSNSFLRWHGELLSAENMKTLYIPEGFAHGFQTLEENCEMLYLHTEYYNKDYESGIRFDDPAVGIEWKMPATNVSDRDRSHRLIDNLFRGVEL